jgi:aminoglycoside phosphotransferase (APT) family kinase protein
LALISRGARHPDAVEEAVERYVARTGFPVPPMDWYFAYNLFRLAGIMQGIKKRVIDGTASSAHAQAMSERVAPAGGSRL